MKYKCSVMIVFAILLLYMVSYSVPSFRIESSENRTLATFNMIFHPETDSVAYRESRVERIEAALSDQFPFREFVVKKYLRLFNASENLMINVVKRISNLQETQYVLHSAGVYELIENTGYITVRPETDPMDPEIVQKRIELFDLIHEKYPNIRIYTYYVTQAFDTPWFNFYLGTKAADHYQEIADAVPYYIKSDHLVYQDLDDYMNLHYKTDHHWNDRGAERGYENIYKMISEDIDLGQMRIPVNENMASETNDFVYLGSYGSTLGELYNEGYDAFSFYEYDLPQRETAVIKSDTLEEIEVEKIGLYDEYQAGEINKEIKNRSLYKHVRYSKRFRGKKLF